MTNSHQKQIDLFFEGQLDPASTTKLFAAIEDDESARHYFERRQQLAALDPQSLDAKERLGASLKLATPKRTLAERWGWALLGSPALAAAVLVGLGLQYFPRDDGFVPRGEATEQHVTVFTVSGGNGSPAQDVILASDALAFSYQTSLDGYLMIFGRHDSGEVFWFYPSWTDPQANPESVRIVASTTPVELPDAIQHDLPAGDLELVALFLNEPEHVKSIEKMLTATPKGTELKIKGSRWSRRFKVKSP